MNRKRMILVVTVVVAAVLSAILLTAPDPGSQRPTTVSFLGFSNALPYPGAPEEVRSLRAVFQVTNHTATTMTYHSEAQGYQVGGEGSSVTIASDELPGYGTGTFMLSTSPGTNGWTFILVSSSSRPRPAWQQFVRELSKWLGGPRILVGPARTFPQFTNTWTTPQS